MQKRVIFENLLGSEMPQDNIVVFDADSLPADLKRVTVVLVANDDGDESSNVVLNVYSGFKWVDLDSEGNESEFEAWGDAISSDNAVGTHAGGKVVNVDLDINNGNPVKLFNAIKVEMTQNVGDVGTYNAYVYYE